MQFDCSGERGPEKCIFSFTALDALFFSCWEFTVVRMCFFGCISLARVFILRVAEFSLSSYRSSKYFLAVDFQLICAIVITRPMVLQCSSQFDAVFEQFKGCVDSRLHEF